jgi:hypothetical protein
VGKLPGKPTNVAREVGRDYLGIELDAQHRFTTAMRASMTEVA